MLEVRKLEETIFTIFKKNIAYLRSNHKYLFDNIVKFENSTIETKYIDFRNNYFELVELNDNKPTYNCNSFKDATYRANHIKSSNAIFSLIVKNLDKKNYNDKNEISAHKFVDEILKLKKDEDLTTNKFIFIGTLLGIHLNDIHKIMNQQAYLIIEPSIETFRLSLFFTDYEEISKTSRLFFSIQENDLEIKKSVFEFLEYKNDFNNYIKFELASEKEYYLVDLLKKIFVTANPFIAPFSEKILSFERGFRNIRNSNGLLKINVLNSFKNLTILILGAGPSLEKFQDFLKLNHEKFLIIAASASLKRLQCLDIVPDIIVNIDKKEEILEQFNVNQKFYKNSIIFLGPKTHYKIIEKISSQNVFIVQENNEIIKYFKTIDCVSVGDFSTKLCLELGAKEIYLLGIDASFDQGKTHDSTHSSYNKTTTDLYENEIIKVKGNFKEFVETSLLYNEIINSFKRINFNEEIKIYNLSDGAKLENCIPLDIRKTTFNKNYKLDKLELYKKIILDLKTNSTQEIPTIDKDEIMLLDKIEKNANEANINLLKKKNPNSNILNIFDKYLTLINPYIEENKKLIYIKEKQIKQICEKLFAIFKN